MPHDGGRRRRTSACGRSQQGDPEPGRRPGGQPEGAGTVGLGCASSSEGSTRSWLKVRGAAPKTTARRRREDDEESSGFEAEIHEEAKAEIAAIEAKLAAIKQKHRLPPGPARK